ncbi:MAG TPA: adenylate/guanylate cyclase domain-containing protein, partial [Moraxellaceae bacterium]
FVLLALLVLLVGQWPAAAEPRLDLSPLPPALLALTRLGNQVTSFACILLLLGVFRREVLRTEAGLVAERDRSHRLLHVILPKKIAGRLQQGSGAIADHHPDVTVLFADIAGFTPWAAGQSPRQVVALLEQVFSRFDALVATAGVEKIKTIGDAYMVISGAPEAQSDHAAVMARLAQAFMNDVAALREETGIPLQLRVGLHTGPVIAGVIGTVRFSYDVWGDTVNTASRMESAGEPGRIHVSAETMSRLQEGFTLQRRGVIDVKGKGSMETWWLDTPV